MNDDEKKRARIVEARRKLRERFRTAQAGSPALSDETPQGHGPRNRHGMPQVPPGQTLTEKWPVLDLGSKPDVTPDAFRLVVDGAVRTPLELTWSDVMTFDQVEDVSDFHCVTTWSKLDIPWRGVLLSDIVAAADPHDTAAFLMCHGSDGYTTNLPLAEALKDDVLLAHSAFGAPLEAAHGGPARIITPQLYAWKGTKWVARLEVLEADRLGFWEERGYSNTAHPWRNDRYS